jgi:putative ABC transport system substrate-binding protein
MTRRHALLVFAGLTAGALGSRLSHAAEPAQGVIRVGIIGMDPSAVPRLMNPFWDRLRELGYVEGQNLIVEQRWADGHLDRLPTLMAEMIERKVDIIIAGGTLAALAAKNATSTIPIVGVGMSDPVRSGFAASLARPGSNVTGMSMGYGEGLSGKWLELLQETVPHLTTVAMIVNPGNPVARDLAKDVEAIAPRRHLKMHILEVREAAAFDGAFEQARRQAQAVLVHGEAFTLQHRGQILALAAKHRLPTMYNLLDFVYSGGLMAYAPDIAVMFRHAADAADKILKGAKPGDLAIEQPTRYVLLVNLKAAKGIGLTIPESILLRADEVIR